MRSALGLLLFVAACGDDPPPPPTDGGPRIDAQTDGGRPVDATVPDASTPDPMCGNGAIEPGESCDDGNATAGDGCAPDCRLEARCGDGIVMAPEVCDDENHLDGDGCRSDCGSDESCGNAEVDVGAAEVCDDGNTADGDGCAGNCLAVEGCGDGSVSGSEACDDGAMARWDGCGPDCRDERTVVVNALSVTEPELGCDLNVDGMPDNLFATALGVLRPIQNAQLESSVNSGVLLLLIPFYGLDDALDDSWLVTSVTAGMDADTDRTNNFTGTANLLAHPDALRADGLPLEPFPAQIAGSMLEAGPVDTRILLVVAREYPETMVLRNAWVRADVTGAGDTITALGDGQLCGALSIYGLAAYGNPLRGVTGFMGVTGCDGQELTSFADVAVGGATVLGISTTRAQPDVDVDGDGLEHFEVLAEGPAGCQPVVSACIDGDGTRVEGADCDLDPRFADGLSANFAFTAVGANVIRIGP